MGFKRFLFIIWIGPCALEHYANLQTQGNSSKTMLERLSHKQFEEKPLTINNLAEIPDTDFYAIFIVIEAQSRLFQFEFSPAAAAAV